MKNANDAWAVSIKRVSERLTELDEEFVSDCVEPKTLDPIFDSESSPPPRDFDAWLAWQREVLDRSGEEYARGVERLARAEVAMLSTDLRVPTFEVSRPSEREKLSAMDWSQVRDAVEKANEEWRINKERRTPFLGGSSIGRVIGDPIRWKPHNRPASRRSELKKKGRLAVRRAAEKLVPGLRSEAEGYLDEVLTLATLGPGNASKAWRGAEMVQDAKRDVERRGPAPSDELLRTVTGDALFVTSVIYSPSGRTLASGGGEGRVKLWDAATGEFAAELDGHDKAVSSIAFRPDGRTVASGSWDGTVKLWDARTGALLRTLVPPLEIAPGVIAPGVSATSLVNSIAYGGDNRTLASGDATGGVQLWDTRTGELLHQNVGGASNISCVAFSPDGRWVVGGGLDERILLCNARTGQLLRILDGSLGSIKSVALSPDGRLIAGGGQERAIELWDAHTGELLRKLTGNKGGIRAVAFSPDGSLLAAGGLEGDLKVWEVRTGSLLRTLVGHEGWINSLTFDPVGRWLASSSDSTIKVWRADRWT